MNVLRVMFVSILLVQPGAVMADNLQSASGAPDEALTMSTRDLEIRHLLGSLLEQGTATVRRVDELSHLLGDAVRCVRRAADAEGHLPDLRLVGVT